MQLPTIHLNGSNAENMLEDIKVAYRAVNAAIEALRQTCPNGRDYYPQGPSAINTAMDEYRARLGKLQEVLSDLETIGVHIADHV